MADSSKLILDDMQVSSFPFHSRLRETAGLPTVPVTANGYPCTLMLDSGSCLNLVGEQFIKDVLGVKSEDIKPADITIKGISGYSIDAVGEVKLTLNVMGRLFHVIFIVIPRVTFPTDLLLSYWGLVFCKFTIDFGNRLLKCEDDAIPFSLSSGAFNLNLASLSFSQKMSNGEEGTVFAERNPIPDILNKNQSSEGVDFSRESARSLPHAPHELSTANLSNSAASDFNIASNQFLDDHVDAVDTSFVNNEHHSLQLLESCFLGEILAAHFKANSDFNVSSERSLFADSSADVSTVLTQLDDKETISLVSVNEDATFLVHVVNKVNLIPGRLTKVLLRAEQNLDTDLLLLNDHFKIPDVDFDTCFCRPEGGLMILYATARTAQPVTLFPGDSFCSACSAANSVSVSEDIFMSLLGQHDGSLESQLNVVDFPEAKRELASLLQKHRKVVALKGEPLGRTQVLQHTINQTEDAKPVYIPNYRLPVSRRDIVESLISDMEQQGVIKESLSPYNSPLLLVPKKDGSWRLVIDYRQLNKQTVPDRLPMPHFEEALTQLSGAKIFSSLDLLSGYHQVPFAEGSKPLTAFSSHSRHWQFECMPFGLTNAPVTFTRLMKHILGDMANVFVYLDDICIFSRTITEHFRVLSEVLQRLEAAGLRLKLSKCQFLKSELHFLGHVISPDGVKMQSSKVEALRNYPTPVNPKGVKRFLGIIGYYRPFIHNFSTIASPLTHLLKKDVRFQWTSVEESAFQDLKACLLKAPILIYPDFSKPFYIACDASNVGLGAVLLQKGNGRLLPVAYASRTLNQVERRYSVTERESLAVVCALKKFCYLVLGFQVMVITDHKTILDLFRKRAFTNNAKFNRYFLSILEYSPSFRYVPGRFNVIADGLSRLVEDELSNCVAFTCQVVDLDLDLVKVEQDKDEEIRNIKADLLLRPETVSDFVLINDCLYLKPCKNNGSSHLFIPKSLVPKVLMICHSHKLAGHPGVKKTHNLISKNCFWKHCRRDAKEFVLNCDVCQLSKGNVMKWVPLEPYPCDLLPFQCVSIDTMGPFPRTTNGNRYILVFVDYLSRYTEIVPVKDRTSTSVAEALRRRIITPHGCPQALLSDNALEFTSELFRKLCEFYQIKKVNIVAHKPFSNGLVERTNRKILEVLRTLVAPKTGDWDLSLDDIQLTVNNTVNEATGETPHFLLYGVECRLPFSLLGDSGPPLSYSSYGEYISFRTRQSWDVIRKTRILLKDAFKRAKCKYDRSSQEHCPKVGQKAYVLKPFKEGPLYKASRKFDGPFRMLRY